MGTPFTNTGAAQITTAGIVFKPGDTHPVDEKYLERLRRSPVVKAGLLREGEIRLPEPPTVKRINLPGGLPQALAAIKVEEDLATLSAWAETERAGDNRVEVLTAIRLRAEQLTHK